MKKQVLVTRPLLPERQLLSRYIERIYSSKWLTNKGPLHDELSEKLKEYLGVKNISLTVNGHIALENTIQGMGLTGEVITTPFTFISTTHAISRNGLTPVFCDIKEADLTIDPACIERLITNKTSAIIPVHVYGHPCDVEAIDRIAQKYNLKVIYDAAHTFGVKYKGHALCSYGDAAILSFHATKIFNTIEGGAIIDQEDERIALYEQLKNFGIHDEEHVNIIGGNGKMNEFQAAMGLSNLEIIEKAIAARAEIAQHYRKRLSEIKGIRFFVPESDPDIVYNYAYFPIIVDENVFAANRDNVYEQLKMEGIFTRKYFYPLVTDTDCYSEYKQSQLSVAKKISTQILCLPIYYGLGLAEVDMICELISKVPERRHSEREQYSLQGL